MRRADDPRPLKQASIALLVLTGALVVAVVAVVALGSQVSGILSTVGAPIGNVGARDAGGQGQAAPPNQGGGAAQGGPPQGAGTTVYSIDRPDLLIVKTGSISIRVGSLDPAIDQATDAIAALGGYVSGSSRSGDGDETSASLTFRVPVDRWEDAFEAVRGIATRVLAEESTTDEVTGEVADLGARIRNLDVTERALQAIMNRATAIKDVLTVQSELTDIRGQIERLATQKAQLEAQAAMSTLTVRISLRHDPVDVVQAAYDPGLEVSAATARLVDILQAVLTAGIWFGIVWLPIIVTLGVVGLLLVVAGYVIARRLRRPGEAGAEVALRP